MKDYKYILFDLDGTLTNPELGITSSVIYALDKFGINELDLNVLKDFIGPPLKESFMKYYGVNEVEASELIGYYRENFVHKGILQNKIYKGIEKLLNDLKAKDYIIGLATSKPTIFAEQILEYFNIHQFFSYVAGSNLDGTRTDKAEIIKHVCNELEVEDKSKCVMIGDRMYDMNGARLCGIDCIGVSYGFGSMQELIKSKASYIVNSVDELNLLLVSRD